ncbi:MBL fold metallo-hydrolase [Streptomyces sp. NPDC058459]|uniref:MBL fold metallo-hydrolase n=1 Tax=Streptomyces sp. NPDC058459 TaxID=3346508 RepID=UPI003647DC27
MNLTKRGHACVRLEKDGGVLVIDPGLWSEEDAAADADVILVTHEHFDHFDEERLRVGLEANPAAGLWAPAAVADQVAAAFPNRVHPVGHGDALTLAGFDVQVHGAWHAVIHSDIPRITNVGYLLDGSVFHPGDALTVPDRSVDTLLLPVQAPWNKIAEVIEYVREVGPRRSVDVHDGLLTDRSRPVYDTWVGDLGGAEHLRLSPGESIDA